MKRRDLYANAHRGKVKKASLAVFPLRIMEEELRPIPAKGWAERGHVPNSLEFGTCPPSLSSALNAGAR